ncbi:FtsX-like permease family protein [Entomoplasma freundtii]|uniref:ABC3 transporter permease C-terminal domain-containing protein n=1 Tax=Entomoplasma freundtii TaxID=74700 RepID=A0A2K8NQS5_9MOLU|nr:ABC transporter permease [Entomoplasma freundtii]ATZ16137.1 hypothetical protein EFREU_v1c01100 [Entomoplasma freundtii]TDY56962.1 FtsX-like permease family protein [Entomoplasma freundtii]
MTFKLVLKQSLHDFFKKILLYVSFTLFLVLSISMSVGLLTFSASFTNLFQQSFGTAPNAMYNVNYRFLPAWVNKEEVEDIPGYKLYQVQESISKENDTKNKAFQTGDTSPLLNFMIETLDLTNEVENNPAILQDIKELLLIAGTLNNREMHLLQLSDFIGNDLLSNQLHLSNDQIMSKFNDANENHKITLPNLINHLVQKYHTTYFLGAYFAEKFHVDDNLVWAQTSNKFEQIGYDNGPLKSFWTYMTISPDLIPKDVAPNFYDETPWQLRTNESIKFKLHQQVNWHSDKYRNYLNNYNFVYVSPRFLHDNNYRVGDTFSLTFAKPKQTKQINKLSFPKNDDANDDEPSRLNFEFLIAGSITNTANFYNWSGPIFLLPHQWVEASWKNRTTNLVPKTIMDLQAWNVKSAKKDLIKAQDYLSAKISMDLTNLSNPNKPVASEVRKAYIDTLPINAFAVSEAIFNSLSITVGLLVLVLLFIVFFFITKEIIIMQRQTLVFLKALGVSNSGLSLLTTFAMLVPLLIGFLGGFFGSLAMQQMINEIALESTSLYIKYFTFHWSFFVFLIAVLIVVTVLFFIINVLFIRKNISTFESQAFIRSKGPAKLIRNFKQKISVRTSPKFQIGLSFAFKNIGKNLVTYFLLTMSFSIILYAIQFKASFATLSGLYERWNMPYKSVVTMNNVPVFAPLPDGDEANTGNKNGDIEYIRSYDTFDNDSSTKPLGINRLKADSGVLDNDGFVSLDEVIKAYREKLVDGTLDFNWKNYYFTQSFTKMVFDWLNANPKNIDAIGDYLKKAGFDDDFIWQAKDLITHALWAYNSVEQNFNYSQGFNIYLGRIFLNGGKGAPFTPRNILSMTTEWDERNVNFSLQAYENNDIETARHFQFNEKWKPEDFIVTIPKEKPTDVYFDKALKINVSKYAQSLYNLKIGQILTVNMPGFNTLDMKMHLIINDVVKEDSVLSNIYSSQAGLLQYLVEMADYYKNNSKIGPLNLVNINYESAYEAYSKLRDLNVSLSNTVYDAKSTLPWGLRNLVIPVAQHTGAPNSLLMRTNLATKAIDNWAPGTRIEDFFSPRLSNYFDSLKNNIMIFDRVTKATENKAKPFVLILNRFIIILAALSFIIALILITLILLENRRVILLFKAMGYRLSEVNWYLISGYFVAAILATITAIGISLGILNSTKSVITDYIGISVYFVWSWQFICLAFLMAAVFCLAISISIVTFTHLQKPRDAFAIL